jgi:glycosyltransferase involved in cell wall biosynthesis
MTLLQEEVIASSVSATAAERPLRIALVTESAGGGVGRHFLDLAGGLAARGHEVVAIYSPGRIDTTFRQRQAGLRGVRFRELPMRRSVHPLDARDAWRLARLLKGEGPFDLVHGHSSKGGALARLAGRWLRVPAIYTPHAIVTLDPTLPPWKRTLYARIECWLARSTAALIAVSNDEADHIRQLSVSSQRLYVVPNGIEQPDFPDRADARRRLGLGPEHVVVGFVGRLTPQKAPDVLLEAFALAARELPDLRLIVVGGGPLNDAVRSRIDQLSLAPRVVMLGDVVATEVLSAFDLFCLSSRYEGLPYVLIEALSAGLPIVATDVGGTRTCVTAGENGLVVPRDNVAELASALRHVAANWSLRQEMAAASTQQSSRFTLNGMLDKTLSIYSEVATRASRRSRVR